nr:MAG TPA: hypothetical protein [Caudoviricetes sp.]
MQYNHPFCFISADTTYSTIVFRRIFYYIFYVNSYLSLIHNYTI